MLDEIKRSGLRGRGGAGFPTGLKWEACRRPRGQSRFVICNADEGEPGTFKDRVLLTAHADLIFEGMTVGRATRSAPTQGFLYLRGEYRYLLEPLEAVLARRRAHGPARQAHPAAEPASTSTSTSSSAPAPISAARNPR